MTAPTRACEVSVYVIADGLSRLLPTPCGKPLAPGKKFCAVHEADRIKLGGTP